MGSVDEFFSKIADQVAVIKATLYPFLFAVAVVIGAVWFIVNYSYSTVISSKNAQLELADRQIADYKQKLGGATPDEAKARIDILEKRLAQIEPRRLTPEQQTKLAAGLRAAAPGTIIQITSDGGCADCNQYAAAIMNIFSTAGWRVTSGLGFGIGGATSPKGLAVFIYDSGNPAPESLVLTQALEAAAIPFDASHRPKVNAAPGTPPSPNVSILITARIGS